MDKRPSNLLDEALGLDQTVEWPLRGRVVAVEDRVETSGSFVLHHLLKRSLSPNSSNVSIFIAFSQPFSHYDRILRKLVTPFSIKAYPFFVGIFNGLMVVYGSWRVKWVI